MYIIYICVIYLPGLWAKLPSSVELSGITITRSYSHSVLRDVIVIPRILRMLISVQLEWGPTVKVISAVRIVRSSLRWHHTPVSMRFCLAS